MVDILHGVPGKEYPVKAEYSDEPEKATADKNGILRNDDGHAYSLGAYEIVGRAE